MLPYTCQLHHCIVWPLPNIMAKNAQMGNNAVLIHFRKVTQKSTPCGQHRAIQSDVLTDICENMQSDRTDCNQTKHKHIHAPAQCTKICHFISGSYPNKKKGENDCMLFTKHALRYTCSRNVKGN